MPMGPRGIEGPMADGMIAQFRDPVQPEWTPVVDEAEPIAGCRVGA